MRNYLIIVEGAHDIAVVERLLSLNGINGRISRKEDLPPVWEHTIPVTFPFEEGRLDRITPIPSFRKNEEVSVAIKNAGSDTKLISILQQMLDTMLIREKVQIDGVMLLCDADTQKAEEKIAGLLQDCVEKEDFKIYQENGQTILDIQVKKLPVSLYVFPDNEGEGNLENILLEAAGAAYPELLEAAREYLEKARKYQQEKGQQQILQKEQYAKKAIVGCIANTIKPGKANQVAIADGQWITQDTLQQSPLLQKLNQALLAMLTPSA
ncbi:MAG: hypothetical protein NC318_00240 [Blautia sp.]|nr:hypothetical protein [Lachnoclostridium sp.]MCM1210015.1 hypothetical protein [Blautia sp.]